MPFKGAHANDTKVPVSDGIHPKKSSLINNLSDRFHFKPFKNLYNEYKCRKREGVDTIKKYELIGHILIETIQYNT